MLARFHAETFSLMRLIFKVRSGVIFFSIIGHARMDLLGAAQQNTKKVKVNILLNIAVFLISVHHVCAYRL